MKQTFRLLILSAVLASTVLAQVSQRAVPTTAQLLAQPPETFSERAAGDANFTAVVTTTGDTVAGTGTRTWMWVGSSTATPSATVLAYPPYATGRWLAVGAVGAGGGTPAPTSDYYADPTDPMFGAVLNDALDDSAALNAAVAWAKAQVPKRALKLPSGTYRIAFDSVNWSDIDIYADSVKFEPLSHPTANQAAPDKGWACIKITGKVNIFGNGFSEFNGRRMDGTYTSYNPSFALAMFSVRDGAQFYMENCVFKDWLHGAVYVRRADSFRFENCVWDNCQQTVRAYATRAGAMTYCTVKNQNFSTSNPVPAAFTFQDIESLVVTGNFFDTAVSSVPAASEMYATWINVFSCPGARIQANLFEPFSPNTATTSLNYIPFDSPNGILTDNVLLGLHNGTIFILLEGTAFATVERNFIGGPRTEYKPFAYSATRARLANVATITTTTPHGFTVGMPFTTTGFSDSTFNGSFTVATVPSTTSFTYTTSGLPDSGSTADTGGVAQVTRSYTPFGIYTIEGAITGMYNGPNALDWRDPGHQLRSMSEAFGARIANNTIINFHTGIWAGTSDTDIIGNQIYGSENCHIRIGTRLTSWPGLYTLKPSLHKPRNVRILNNRLSYSRSAGIRLGGITGCEIAGNLIVGNEQDGITMDMPSSNSGTVQAGSTTTSINISTSLGSADRELYSVYFPDTDQVGYIRSHTSSNLQLVSALATLPAEGDRYVISYAVGDDYDIHDNRFQDGAAESAMNGIISYNPTQTIGPTATNLFAIETSERQLFFPGRRVVLKDFLVSGDLQARVAHLDGVLSDRVWLVATSPTSGTIRTSTGAAVFAGTGTVSFTDSPGSLVYENRSQLTGSGTSFSTQLHNSTWIRVGSDWRMISHALSDTSARLTGPFPGNFSGQAFDYISGNVTFLTVQDRAWSVFDTPGRFNFRNNLTYGMTASPPELINLTTAPNAIPKLTGTTPTVGRFQVYRLANTSPTTVHNFLGATTGYEALILGDGQTTLDFTGSSLKGNAGVDKSLSVNAMARISYANGLWFVEVMESP